MTAQLLDGRKTAETLRASLTETIRAQTAAGVRPPGLAVVQVGEDPASSVYVANKRKACAKLGIQSFSHDLSEDTAQADLDALIDQLNADPQVDGILVQLPLPEHLSADSVIERIAPDKDVDGFHPVNIGRLTIRRPGLRPCTPYGVMHLLAQTGQDLHGKEAVIVGASNIVGRPMALELMLAGATVTVTHRFTRDLQAHVQRAEILVVAAGKMDLVDPAWITPGAVVIDVGIHRLDDGSLRGDLDFTAAAQRAGFITPVPGGVGPMTIAMLMYNTVHSWQARLER